MRRILASALVLFLAPSCMGQDPAVVPEGRPDTDWWMKMHQSFVDRAKRKDVDLLFLGDSITQNWGENAVWERYYAPRRAANFGIGGDRTQHILWRIEHGELDGLSPRVVVLLVGTNNIGTSAPEEIAEGIKAIVATLREKLPTTKVLLLGVFPRGRSLSRIELDKAESAAPIDAPGAINARIAELGRDPMVTYLDISKAFLDDDGSIPKTLMPDFLHLSEVGYRRWAEAMEPTLWELMR